MSGKMECFIDMRLENRTLCMVCNHQIKEPTYNLESIKSQVSNVFLSEKLCTLVGKKYEPEFWKENRACRGCSTKIYNLEKLECEALAIRNSILQSMGQLPPNVMPSKPIQSKEKGPKKVKRATAKKSESLLKKKSKIWLQDNANERSPFRNQRLQYATYKYAANCKEFESDLLPPTEPCSSATAKTPQDDESGNNILEEMEDGSLSILLTVDGDVYDVGANGFVIYEEMMIDGTTGERLKSYPEYVMVMNEEGSLEIFEVVMLLDQAVIVEQVEGGGL